MLDFVAIDFETANSHRGSACAVGLVRVRSGQVVDEKMWFIRPPEKVDRFDNFNTWVHGITAEMVVDAPRWSAVLPRILEFIGDDVVVAHNASFDIGVIRQACAVDGIEWPTLQFLCTMIMSRRALSLPSYRLPFVIDALSVAMGDHHDPLSDALGVVEIVRALAFREGAATIEDLCGSLQVNLGRMTGGAYKGSLAVRTGGGSGVDTLASPDVNPNADPDGYLFGRVVVFTGKLMSMTRQDAWDACAGLGAAPENNTTKRTNILVVGDLNPARLRPGEELSSKARRAYALQSKGQTIELMTEDDFLRCMGDGPL